MDNSSRDVSSDISSNPSAPRPSQQRADSNTNGQEEQALPESSLGALDPSEQVVFEAEFPEDELDDVPRSL